MYASWASSYLCKRVNFNLSVFIAVLSFLLLSLLCGQKAAREVFCAGCIPDICFHLEFHCIHVVWCWSSCFHFIWRMCSSMQLSWCSLWGIYLWDWFLLWYLCMIRSVLISHKPEVICFLSRLCLLSNLCFLCLEQWWSLCSINFLAFEVGLVLSWLSNLKNKLALWFLAC